MKVLSIITLSAIAYLLPAQLSAQPPKKTNKVSMVNGVTADYASKDAETDTVLIKRVITALTRDSIIKDAQHLSFKLDKKQFVVNGTQQPAAVTKRYQANFLKRTDWIISYDAATIQPH